MAASVPDEVKRMRSMDGIRSRIRSPSSTSSGLVAPSARPSSAPRTDGLDDCRVSVAEDGRAPGTDEVHVAVAVRVQDVGAVAALQDQRLAANRAEGTHGAVDAAGEQRLGPPP